MLIIIQNRVLLFSPQGQVSVVTEYSTYAFQRIISGAFIGAFIFRNASPYEVLGIPAVLFVVLLLVSVEDRKRVIN